jgi:hypothetical protein
MIFEMFWQKMSKKLAFFIQNKAKLWSYDPNRRFSIWAVRPLDSKIIFLANRTLILTGLAVHCFQRFLL